MTTFKCSCCRRGNLAATSFEVVAGVQRLTCRKCKTARKTSYAKRAATRPTKPNAWVLHITQFAATNNITYGAAMRLRACSTAFLRAKWLTGFQANFLRELETGDAVLADHRRPCTESEIMLELNACVDLQSNIWRELETGTTVFRAQTEAQHAAEQGSVVLVDLLPEHDKRFKSAPRNESNRAYAYVKKPSHGRCVVKTRSTIASTGVGFSTWYWMDAYTPKTKIPIDQAKVELQTRLFNICRGL